MILNVTHQYGVESFHEGFGMEYGSADYCALSGVKFTSDEDSHDVTHSFHYGYEGLI